MSAAQSSPGIAYYDPKTGTAILTTGEKISYAPPSPKTQPVKNTSSGGGGSPSPFKNLPPTSYNPPQSSYIPPAQPQPMSTIENPTPAAAPAKAAEPSKAAEPYVYETTITGPEPAGKVQDIERWGRMQGIQVIRTSTPEELQQGQYKVRIISEKPLQDELGFWKPGIFPLTTRTGEQIKQERITAQAAEVSETAYEEANPIEKTLLHTSTALSMGGEKYWGSTVKVVIPEIKSPEYFVKERLKEKIIKQAQRKYGDDFYGMTIPDEVMDAIFNPVVQVETFFIPGYGLAKLAATQTGAKILGSTVGKVILVGSVAAPASQIGYEIYSSASSGNYEEAIGRGMVATGAIASGYSGFKAASNSAKTVMTVDFSKTRGISLTEQGPERSVSTGVFEITEGKLRGLRGKTVSVTNEETGFGSEVIGIPKQKVGNVKVKAQTVKMFLDETEVRQVGANKIYARNANTDLLKINEQPVKVVGPDKAATVLREVARVVKSTDRGEVVMRQFEGIGEATTAGKYGLGVVKKGPNAYVIEERVLSAKTVSKIDWIDVAKAELPDVGRAGKPEPYIRGGGPKPPSGGPRGGVKVADTGEIVKPAVVKETAPAIPSGISKIAVEQTVKARMVPPVTAGVKAQIAVEQTVKARMVPPITGVKSQQNKSVATATVQMPALKVEKSKRSAIAAMAVTVNAITPDVKKITAKLTAPTVPDVTQRTAQRQATELMTAQKAVVVEAPTPNTPIPVIPIENVKVPGTPIPNIPILLTLGPSRARRKNYGLGVIKNPVPDIDKII